MSFDLATTLKTVAPTLATLIGGPLAGGAVTALEGVFGIGTTDPTGSSDLAARLTQVSASLQGATPEQLAAVRKADQDYAARMAEAGFKNVSDMEALSVQDRASARQMQMTTKSWVAPCLAVLVTVGFFGALMTMMFGKIPAAEHDALMLMLGSLGTAWTGVMAYYFGSSASHAQTTDLLAKSTPPK